MTYLPLHHCLFFFPTTSLCSSNCVLVVSAVFACSVFSLSNTVEGIYRTFLIGACVDGRLDVSVATWRSSEVILFIVIFIERIIICDYLYHCQKHTVIVTSLQGKRKKKEEMTEIKSFHVQKQQKNFAFFTIIFIFFPVPACRTRFRTTIRICASSVIRVQITLSFSYF